MTISIGILKTTIGLNERRVIKTLGCILLGFMYALPSFATPQFQDVFGNRVVVKQSGARVISLAPSVTESLFAIGAQEQLVGVTRFCNYPLVAQKLPKVGGLLDLNMEAIAKLQPDLIIALASGETRRQTRLIKKLFPGRLVVFKTETVAELSEMWQQMGKLLNRQVEAKVLTDRLSHLLEVPAVDKVVRSQARVALLVGCRPPMVVGGQNFLNEWIRLGGGDNSFSSTRGYFAVDVEQLVLAKMNWLLIAASEQRSAGDECANFVKRLEANGPINVRYLPADIFQRPGPRIFEAIEMLADILRLKKGQAPTRQSLQYRPIE